MKNFILCLIAMFVLAACNNDDGKGDKGGTKNIPSASVKPEKFPNVSQKILGTWKTEVKIYNQNTNRTVIETVKFYFSNNETAVLMSCQDSNGTFADIAAISPSTISTFQVTLKQDVQLKADEDCVFNVPADSLDYTLDQSGNYLNLTYKGEGFGLTRINEIKK